MKKQTGPLVGVIMGSMTDWPTMKAACEIMKAFDVEYETKIVSAHRTPHLVSSFVRDAEQSNIKVIIAGAGGAAHLPGMVAAHTALPVLGVPVQSKALSGLDSLLSIVQMPGGVPVATFAIGESGAKNAALFAIAILAFEDDVLRIELQQWRQRQTDAVLNTAPPTL